MARKKTQDQLSSQTVAYNRGYSDGQKWEIEFKEDVVTIGKILAGVTAGIFGIFLTWQFIHWAAAPDLSGLESKIDFFNQNFQVQSETLEEINGRIGLKFPNTTFTPSNSGSTTTIVPTPNYNCVHDSRGLSCN